MERLNTSITIIDQEKKELNGKLQQVWSILYIDISSGMDGRPIKGDNTLMFSIYS